VLSDYPEMGFDAEASDYVQRCREMMEKGMDADKAEKNEKE